MSNLFGSISSWLEDGFQQYEAGFNDLQQDIREQSVRAMIVMKAAEQARLGAHYLTGAYGAMPGEADNVANREIELLEDQTFDTLAIHTARRRGAKKRCLGRYAHDHVVGRKVTDADALDALKQQCEDREDEGLPATNWPTHDGLYPRRGKDSKIYYGEDCRGKRHFDCIGFVNWVLSETLGRRFRYEIFQFEGNRNTSFSHAAPVTVKRTKPFPFPKNADIVTNVTWKLDEDDADKDKDKTDFIVTHDHIGFLTADSKVIHASRAAKGVIISDYKPSDWTGHCRLHKRVLQLGCEHLSEKRKKTGCYWHEHT